MLRIQQEPGRLTLRQYPVELYLITGLFALPSFVCSLSQLLTGTLADGTYVLLLFAIVFTWAMLDFAALREEIIVDRGAQTLTRRVQGLFRSTREVFSLKGAHSIVLERRAPDQYGMQYLYLHLRVGEERHLINNPLLLHNEHQQVGELLGEFLGIPFHFSNPA